MTMLLIARSFANLVAGESAIVENIYHDCIFIFCLFFK